MKHKRLSLALVLIVLGGVIAYAQDALEPRPKKARTPEDYKPRSLKEVAARDSDAESRLESDDKLRVYGDILPSRVRITYKGSARPMPRIKKDTLHRWAQLYAGAPEHYTKPYERELLFSEDGKEYWLAFRKESIAQFKKQFKKRQAVDLFLIRLGAVRNASQWEPLLLVESFQKPK